MAGDVVGALVAPGPRFPVDPQEGAARTLRHQVVSMRLRSRVSLARALHHRSDLAPIDPNGQ